MLNAMIGSKLGMSQTFVEGKRFAVTRVRVGPCVVTQIKKYEKEGFWAVQLGFGQKKLKNTSRQLQGHLKTTLKDNKASRFLREIRIETEPEYKVGDMVNAADIFSAGDSISVMGISKGKGFAGGVKRWHFSGGPKTHGQSDRQRAPGSIGQGTTPGRVYKGKHMAGRMGSDRVTVKNLKVISINPGESLLEISGPVPGIPDRPLIIKKLT